MILKRVAEEQSITPYMEGVRNRKQFDLLDDYTDRTIASLWLGNDNNYRYTIRFDGSDEVRLLGEYGEFEEVVNDFIREISEYIEEQMQDLQHISNQLEEDVSCEF